MTNRFLPDIQPTTYSRPIEITWQSFQLGSQTAGKQTFPKLVFCFTSTNSTTQLNLNLLTVLLHTKKLTKTNNQVANIIHKIISLLFWPLLNWNFRIRNILHALTILYPSRNYFKPINFTQSSNISRPVTSTSFNLILNFKLHNQYNFRPEPLAFSTNYNFDLKRIINFNSKLNI